MQKIWLRILQISMILCFEFSANIAYRIVKEKNISKDIAQEVFMYFLEEEDKLDYSDEEMFKSQGS